MKIANVIVPQGVGDIFWVYQKICHYFDEINFQITIVGDHRLDIQKRSEGLIKYFPKVNSIEYIEYGQQIDNFIHKELKTLKEVFSQIEYDPTTPPHVTAFYHFRLQVNIWLEAGVPLDEIDKELKTEYNIPLPTSPIPNFPSKYLLAYISGDTERHQKNIPYLWTPEVWVKLIVKGYHKLFGNTRKFPIVLTGAQFDTVTLDKIHDLLTPYGFKILKVYQPPAANLFWLLSNATYFINYQSGLSILAENFKTPQLMVYFPVYPNITNTWVSPEGRLENRFSWCYFDTPFNEILSKIPTLSTI